MRMHAVLLAGFACLAAVPAVAQTPTAGKWVLARSSEWPDVCKIRLTKEPGIGGSQVKLAGNCGKLAKWTADIAAWRPDRSKGVVFADAARKTLIFLSPLDDGDYIGPGPDGIDYVLSKE